MSPPPADPFDRLNPYASPAVAQPVELPWEAAGIGVWRHGSLLVVHEQAELPKGLCIKSGQPATHVREVQMRWSHWARWPREYLQLQVSVTRSWNFWLGRGQRYIFIGMLVFMPLSALELIGAKVLLVWISVETAAALITLSLFLAGVGFISWFALSNPLLVVGRWRRYFWLAGAHRHYLAQLPEWPYGT